MGKTEKSKKVIVIIIIMELVLIIALGSVFGVLLNRKKTNKVHNILSMADSYLLDLDYEQAIIEFDKVLAIDKKNVDAYIGIADAYICLAEIALEEGDFKQAKRYYRKAVEKLEEGMEIVDDRRLIDKKEEIEEKSENAEENAEKIKEKQEAEAAKEKEKEEEAKKAEEEAETEGREQAVATCSKEDLITALKGLPSDIVYAEFYYIDGDDIPELYTTVEKELYSNTEYVLWKLNGNQFVQMGKFYESDGVVQYCEKSGIFYTSSGRMGLYFDNIIQMDGYNLKTLFEGRTEEPDVTPGVMGTVTYYFINDKELSEEEYKAAFCAAHEPFTGPTNSFEWKHCTLYAKTGVDKLLLDLSKED